MFPGPLSYIANIYIRNVKLGSTEKAKSHNKNAGV